MLEKHAIACDMMHGFDWAKWATGKPDGKKRWVQVVTELSRGKRVKESGSKESGSGEKNEINA